LDSEFFTESSYVDLGIEDTPDEDGVTLLWKSSCINNQMEATEKYLRHNSEPKSRVQQERFPWSLTRDASSVDYTFKAQSTMFKRGIVQGKMYSPHKEIFSVIPKDLIPFGKEQLNILGMDSAHRLWDPPRSTTERKRLKKIFLRTCKRVHMALKDSESKTFGVRQEYRIRFNAIQHWMGLDANTTNVPFVQVQQIGDENMNENADQPGKSCAPFLC
jgi:hypothetical protein